jgi:AcrR family transcriptional regulator
VSETPEDLRKWRLPRGRHGLPRELVTRSQRERLLAAVVRATAAKGYGTTTVADILDQAGVGRETFYELFEDKRSCALAARTILAEDLEGRVREAYMEPGEWPERARNALSATLDWFASDPAAARFMLVELGSMGTESRIRFQEEFNRFVSLLDEGLEGADSSPDVAQATRSCSGGPPNCRGCCPTSPTSCWSPSKGKKWHERSEDERSPARASPNDRRGPRADREPGLR